MCYLLFFSKINLKLHIVWILSVAYLVQKRNTTAENVSDILTNLYFHDEDGDHNESDNKQWIEFDCV